MKYVWGKFVLLLCFFIFFTPLAHMEAVNSGNLPEQQKISELIKMNGEVKQQGYYTGDVEFKFLGIAYYYDHGDSLTGSQKLNKLYTQMKTREGLIKIPVFKDKKEELTFYKSLQNPQTGAFMDTDYPLFTYIGPTINVLEHIELLCRETGEPLKLNYPLKFLDDINTPQKLTVFLNDLSAVGPIGAKFPKTPYIAATELLNYQEIEDMGLYTFSDAWKNEILKWYYNNQSKTSGYWGPRLLTTKKQPNGGELGTTYHITKLFADDQGNNRSPLYPLRYKKQMVKSTLVKLSEPMPDDLAQQHDWSLTRYQGMKLLTNFLWDDMTKKQKEQASYLMADLLCNRAEKFFIPSSGAFSLYSNAAEPDLDGTGAALGMMEIAGTLPDEQQKRLWKDTRKLQSLGTYKQEGITDKEIEQIQMFPEVNTIRVYTDESQVGGLQGVEFVLYPTGSRGLDAADVLPRMKKWVSTTTQSMGNWESKENIQSELNNIYTDKMVQTLHGNLIGEATINILNSILQKKGKLILVGMDMLQCPRVCVTYELIR